MDVREPRQRLLVRSRKVHAPHRLLRLVRWRRRRRILLPSRRPPSRRRSSSIVLRHLYHAGRTVHGGVGRFGKDGGGPRNDGSDSSLQGIGGVDVSVRYHPGRIQSGADVFGTGQVRIGGVQQLRAAECERRDAHVAPSRQSGSAGSARGSEHPVRSGSGLRHDDPPPPHLRGPSSSAIGNEGIAPVPGRGIVDQCAGSIAGPTRYGAVRIDRPGEGEG
mmetsp:Transcript_42222/g.128077  ORF Transcript_42222/g.128077 Transcript_42222/m.128077 type:complete len:219 (-) Transcript_42222:548-1204(-)